MVVFFIHLKYVWKILMAEILLLDWYIYTHLLGGLVPPLYVAGYVWSLTSLTEIPTKLWDIIELWRNDWVISRRASFGHINLKYFAELFVIVALSGKASFIFFVQQVTASDVCYAVTPSGHAMPFDQILNIHHSNMRWAIWLE